MPLDYDALTNGVSQAREQGHSDEEIFKHLASKNQGFKEALDAGYELQDVIDHLQSKQNQGGEQNEDQIRNQPQADQEGNARRVPDQQEPSIGSQEGIQANGMLRPQDQGQRERNDQAYLINEGQTQNAQGGIQGAQAGQGMEGQVPARNQEEVKPQETGVQSAFSKIRDFGATALSSIGQSIYGSLSGIARTEPEYIELPSYGTKIKNPRYEESKDLVDFFERQKSGAADIEALGAKPLTGVAKTAAEVTGGLLKLPAQALTGPIGFASMIGEAFGSQKDAVYQKAKEQGLSDEDAINKANFEATASTAAALPLYYVGGKVAGVAADKLVSETAPKLAQVATRFGLNAVANSVASAASRGVTAALSGESITDAMKNVDVPGVIQDIAFAAHSTATHFQEQVTKGNAKQAARDLPDPILEEVAKDPRYSEAVAPEVKARAESRMAQQAEETNLPDTAKVLEVSSEAERVATPEVSTPEQPAEAPAEAQPTEPSETKVKETSGIPSIKKLPANEQTAIEAKERVAQGNRKGEEEIEGLGYPSKIKEENIPVEELHGKTAREGLIRIATDPNMPQEWKDLAETFSKIPSKMLDEDKVIDQTKLPSNYKKYRGGRAARYRPTLLRPGYIGIAKNGFESARTYIHETGHTITADSIHKWVPTSATTGKKYAEALESALKNSNTPDPIKRLINLYKSALEQRGETEKYLGSGDFVKSDKPYYFDKIDYPEGTIYQTGVRGRSEISSFEKLFKDAGVKYKLDKYQGGGRFRISPEEMEKLISEKQKHDLEIDSFQDGKTYTITGLKLKQPASASARPDVTVRKGSVYGFGNLHEFVSETWSSPQFRELLKGLKGDGKESMWQTFVKIISKILGIDKGSIAEAVIDTSLDISRLRGKELEGKEYEPPKRLIGKEKKIKEVPPVVEKPITPQGTRLHEAAYQPRDGVRFVGENHDEALKKALDAGEITKDFYDQVAGDENAENRNFPEFGFTTNHIDESGNREFVDRKQGHEISSKAGQLLVDEPKYKHPEGGYYLHSNETSLDAYPEIKKPEISKEEVVSKEDPLVELSKKIKASSTAKPKASIVDLAKTSQAIADQVSKGKDAVTKGIASVRGAFEATKNAYLNLPKWVDFKEALGQWNLADTRTSLKVRKVVKDLKKSIPDPLKREAITNWIQAGGDEALLRERANASKPKYKKGYEAALKLSDEEKAHAQNISKYLSDMLEEGINSGMLNHGIENYITQVWKKENPVTRKLQASLQGGKLNKNFQFAKKRVFDSYFEGEQAGYEPASKDVVSLIASYDLSFRKTQAVRAFVKSMTEGKAEDGKPLVQLSGYAQPVSEEGQPPSAYLIKPQARPEGAVSEDGRPYVSINHPAFKGWKWTMNGPDGKPVLMESDMLVHPDVASQIKNITSTSWFKANKIPVLSNAIDTILKFSSILKQTKLSLSLFHLAQEGIHSLSHRLNPLNLHTIDLNDPKQSELVAHGLQLADYQSQELFSEGLAGGGLVGKIPVIGKMQNWFNDFLFKDYIPKLKMNLATHALERNIARYSKKISMDQIYELTAAQANAAFGELNYKFMARNQTIQDMMRLFLLAPDFLEARSRFVAQALKPYGAEQRAALALMGVTLYVGSRILNQVLDQDPHWNKPFSVFHEGREYRLRTVLGDVSELVEKPNVFFTNRLSPFGRAGIEFITGKDSRGIKRNAIEQAEDFLSWFVPIPIQRQPSSTVGSQILSSMGLSNYQHMAQTDVYDRANKWLKQQPSQKIQSEVKKREQATMAESSYKQLKSGLLAGNMDFAAKEYNRLIKEEGKTRQDFDRAFRTNRPFTGSFANEKQFTSTLDNEGRIEYNKAINERKLILQRLQQLQGLK
jgi:hypothetical protein